MTSTHEKVRYIPKGKREGLTPISAATGIEQALKILEGRWKLVILFQPESAAEDARDRLIKIDMRLNVFATKEDLHKKTSRNAWKIFGGCALWVAAVYFIARHVG